MVITRMEQIEALPEGDIRARITFRSGATVSRRIRKDKDDLGIKFAVYAKGSRTKGNWYYDFNSSVTAVEPIASAVKSEAEVWEKSWRRALKMLEESGLWEEVKQDIEVALAVGYEKMKAAYAASWTEGDRGAAVKAVDERLVETDDEGKEHFDSSIVWYMHIPAKIKAMWFGKHERNDHYKNQIAEAMRNKTPLHFRTTAGYDVSVEYNPDLKKMWYSEEYRGCGNGHYYLALNATHALFYEDD